MKNVKKYLYIVLAMSLILNLTACSKKDENININITKLSRDLLKDVNFNDELNSIDDATIHKLYGVDYAEEKEVYITSGATAEEVAIFKLKNSEDAKKALKQAQNRIEEQKENFENYVPEELPKLENALVEKYGNYVILVVSKDKNIENIVKNHIE